MKFFKSNPWAMMTLAALLLVSCGENKEKTTSTDKMSSSDTMVTTNPSNENVEHSTIVSTPQHMLLIRMHVGNFAKWRLGYDARDSIRLTSGLHSYVIGRGVTDSNMVFVALKADDMAKAKAYAADPSLRQAMQKAGVTGAPTFQYVTMLNQDTARVSSAMRSMTNFMVKDWAAWQTAFEQGKQERIDNGITVRAYGHDPDNDKKVTLVTAVIDSVKAAAYWKSDMLKNRRAASGVIGEPTRFLFYVVQRFH